jgi:hypothetical protein
VTPDRTTCGTHRLTPLEAVAQFGTFEYIGRHLRGPHLAELRLLPGEPTKIAWAIPGARRPRDHADWLDEVPARLGEADATMHLWPVGAEEHGPESPSGPGRPMTLGLVVPGCVEATDHGVHLTRLPPAPALVPLGHNLGAYLSGLTPSPSPADRAKAFHAYWPALLAVLIAIPSVYCPCGRPDFEDHRPAMADPMPAGAPSEVRR